MRRVLILELMLAVSLAISLRYYEERGRRVELYDFREHVRSTKKRRDLKDLKLVFESTREKSTNLAVIGRDSRFRVFTTHCRKVVLDKSKAVSLYNRFYGIRFEWFPYFKIARLSGSYLIPGIDRSSKECVITDDNLQPLWKIARKRPKDLSTIFSGGYIQFRDGGPLYVGYMRGESHRPDRRHRLPLRHFFGLWDVREKKVLWEIETPGPFFTSCNLDIDGDGYKDIILGCTNGENGFTVSGATNMGRAQLWVLDRFNNVFFRKTYWGFFADVYSIPGDFDGDGIDELLIVNPLHYTYEGGLLEILDLRGGLVLARRHFEGETPEVALVADLDGDGEKEIILGTSGGRVEVYDFALKVRKTRYLSFLFSEFSGDTLEHFIHVSPLQVCDFDGDGRNELLLALEYSQFFYRTPRGSHRHEKWFVVLLDDNLNVLRQWKDQRIGAICDLEGDGINELVLSGERSTQVWRFER